MPKTELVIAPPYGAVFMNHVRHPSKVVLVFEMGKEREILQHFEEWMATEVEPAAKRADAMKKVQAAGGEVVERVRAEMEKQRVAKMSPDLKDAIELLVGKPKVKKLEGVPETASVPALAHIPDNLFQLAIKTAAEMLGVKMVAKDAPEEIEVPIGEPVVEGLTGKILGFTVPQPQPHYDARNEPCAPEHDPIDPMIESAQHGTDSDPKTSIPTVESGRNTAPAMYTSR